MKVQPEEGNIEKVTDFSKEYKNSSFLSKLFFLWTWKVISYAKKHKGIDERVKIIEMAECRNTSLVCNEFERKIDELKAKNPSFRIRDSIGWVLILTYKKLFAVLLLTAFLSDASTIVNLYLTIYFVKWLVDPTSTNWLGYIFALVLVIIQLFTSCSRNYYLFKTAELGITIRKGLSGMIFKKILRFNENSKHKASTGKLVSLISGELQSLERGLVIVPYAITSPIVFIVMIVLVGIYFKEAVIFGAILGFIIFILQFYAARKIKSYKYEEGAHSEKRIKIISDIINGIRTIKVYAWEIPFARLAQKFRKRMVKYLVKNEFTESSMRGLGFAGGYIIGLPIYGYHYAMGKTFIYQDSLAAISMLGASSQLVFQQFFMALSVLSNFLAILKRIGEVLDMEEFDSKELKVLDEGVSGDYEFDTKDFDFSAKNPKLFAVAGIVGSGKSTLLSCLISKIIKENRQCDSNVTLAYVEQEPFIISGTLKENILFGLEYDEERMNNVIDVC